MPALLCLTHSQRAQIERRHIGFFQRGVFFLEHRAQQLNPQCREAGLALIQLSHQGLVVSNDLRSWLQRQGSNLHKSSKTKEKSKGNAQGDAQRLVPLGRDLSLVVTAWSKLPAPLKTAILAIVQSVNSSEEAAP